MNVTLPRPLMPRSPELAHADTYTWNRALKRGFIALIVSRILVMCGAAIVVVDQAVQARLDGKVPLSLPTGLVRMLDSWDGHWYLEVVRSGYPHHIEPHVTYFVPDARAAFFPLFPRIIHYLAMALPGGPVSTALLFNLALSVVFIYLVGSIAQNLFDNKTAEKAMVIAALFPGSFVFSMAYSEAALLVLAALAFVALHNKRWVWAGVLALLAASARPNGIAVGAACAVVALNEIRQHKNWKALIAPALSPWGFIGFMIFLKHQTGENLAWFRVQHEAWNEGTSFGITAIVRTLKFVANPVASPTSAITAACMALLVFCLWTLRKYKLPTMYVAYSVVVIALMLLPATVTARPRFLYTAFPLIFPVARQFRDDDNDWWLLALALLAGGLVTLMGLFSGAGAIP
jgi:hypothetical protein